MQESKQPIPPERMDAAVKKLLFADVLAVIDPPGAPAIAEEAAKELELAAGDLATAHTTTAIGVSAISDQICRTDQMLGHTNKNG